MPLAVKDGISSAAVTDGAQYDCYYGDAAVLIASPSFAAVSRASPSIVIDKESSTVSVASNKASSTGNDSLATVTIRTYDTVYYLYFNTTFGTAFNIADEVASAVTIMTTAVKMMTNNMNNAVYFAFVSSDDNDTESSTISVADEATSAVSCYSSNYLSSIYFRQFDHITLVFSTLLSLHRTLYLTISSLLLLISNPIFIFDTIIWLMYIHVTDEYLYITGVCCRTKWVQSPEWVFPLNE